MSGFVILESFFLKGFFYFREDIVMKRKEIIDDVIMKCVIICIIYEIIECNKNLDNIVLVGIKIRGVFLVKCI